MTMIRPLMAVAAAAALSACASTPSVWPFGGDKPKDAPSETADGRISILSFEQKLEADTGLAGRTPALPEPVAIVEWPQPGGSPDNLAPHAVVEGAFEVASRRSIGSGSSDDDRISAPPVVANGKIYVLDSRQRLSAFPLEGGGRLWSKELAPSRGRDRHALNGGVAVADGRVYVASGFGFAAAFDAETGAEIWRTKTGSPFHAAPTAAGGRMFAVTTDSELMAMDGATGAVQWTHQAIAEPARILSASSPAVKDDVIVSPFASGEVVALLAANGRRLWVDALSRAGRLTSLSSINDIAGRPVIIGGVIYAASHSGVLAAIDQRSGQRIWARGLASTQTPFIAGDTLFIVTVDGELAAIERMTGQAFWVTQLRRFKDEKDRKGRIAWTGPILVGGKLFLASSEGEGAIVDPSNGQLERTIKIGAPVYIPPIVAGGRIHLLTDEGTLVSLR